MSSETASEVRLVAMTAAQRELLTAVYDEYANDGGLAALTRDESEAIAELTDLWDSGITEEEATTLGSPYRFAPIETKKRALHKLRSAFPSS